MKCNEYKKRELSRWSFTIFKILRLCSWVPKTWKKKRKSEVPKHQLYEWRPTPYFQNGHFWWNIFFQCMYRTANVSNRQEICKISRSTCSCLSTWDYLKYLLRSCHACHCVEKIVGVAFWTWRHYSWLPWVDLEKKHFLHVNGSVIVLWGQFLFIFSN